MARIRVPEGPGAEPPDRVALVTGAASGIGRAVVDDLTRHGYRVVAFDRDQPSVPYPSAVTTVTGDVRVPEDNHRAVDTAVRSYGRLDVFIGNAGVHDGGAGLRDRSATELATLARAVFDVDVLGYLLGARASVDALARHEGCMIFTLSDASFVVTGNGAGVAYVAAKHAALGIVRQLAADLAPHVRVNAVAPGGVVTGLRAVHGDGRERAVFADAPRVQERIRECNPLGVVLTPRELAPCYRFLAGSEAVGMTGEVLRPDGGLAVR